MGVPARGAWGLPRVTVGMALKIILAHIEVYSRQCVFQAHERVFESVCLWNIDPFRVRGHRVPLASLVPIPSPGAEWPFRVCRMNNK